MKVLEFDSDVAVINRAPDALLDSVQANHVFQQRQHLGNGVAEGLAHQLQVVVEPNGKGQLLISFDPFLTSPDPFLIILDPLLWCIRSGPSDSQSSSQLSGSSSAWSGWHREFWS